MMFLFLPARQRNLEFIIFHDGNALQWFDIFDVAFLKVLLRLIGTLRRAQQFCVLAASSCTVFGCLVVDGADQNISYLLGEHVETGIDIALDLISVSSRFARKTIVNETEKKNKRGSNNVETSQLIFSFRNVCVRRLMSAGLGSHCASRENILINSAKMH